ncbi:reverse transcriptase domain-containing protein [Tanacetum coccineum]
MDDDLIFDTTADLGGEEEVVKPTETGVSAALDVEVSAARPAVTTVSSLVTIDSVTITAAEPVSAAAKELTDNDMKMAELKTSKPKVVTTVLFNLCYNNYNYKAKAFSYTEKTVELEEEAKRQEEASMAALAELYDAVQAQIDADQELAARMTLKEHEKYTVEERARMLAEFIKNRKKQLAVERAEANRIKPPTKSQLRNLMMTYLKNTGRLTHAQLKHRDFEEIHGLYNKEKELVDTFVPIGSEEDERRIKDLNTKAEEESSNKDVDSTNKRKKKIRMKRSSKKQKTDADLKEEEQLKTFLSIVPNEEEAIKYEVLDKRVFRADGSSRYIKTFTKMVSRFDRMDFLELHNIVMQRFETTTPEGIDQILLVLLVEGFAAAEVLKNLLQVVSAVRVNINTVFVKSSESEAESWGNDKDDSNNEQDSSGKDSDQKNDSDDNKTQSDNENESDSEHETDENKSGSESDQEENEDVKEEVKDELMDYTTSELYDDVDIRLNEPVDTDKEFVQEEGIDAAMTNVQHGNENTEIIQVIEDAHVPLSTVPQKTEVLVTSSSHSSDLAAKFLNFFDIPHTDAQIVSLMDVHVHHEVPKHKHHTPKVLSLVFQFNNRVTALEKEVAPLHTQVTALVDDHLDTRECYEGLKKSYTLNKTIFSTYGKVYSLKRSRKDKDEDSSVGSDRGLKKRKTNKDAKPTKEEPEFEVADTDMPQDQEEKNWVWGAWDGGGSGVKDGNDDVEPKEKVESKRDWFTKPTQPQEPIDPDWNVDKTPQQGQNQSWLMTLASSVDKLSNTFDELISTPIDFFAFIMNGLKINNLNQETLESHIVENNVEVMRKHGYVYLKEIVVRKSDNDLYRFKEGDFPRLRINNIEDMLLLIIQNRLTNLSGDDVSDFAIALRMFTKSLVIQKRVEDLQLGFESYQKKINVTKPETTKSGIRKIDPYTPYQDPQGFIYVDNYRRNRLMRSDELYKFSDRTLTGLRTSLDDITKNIRMNEIKGKVPTEKELVLEQTQKGTSYEVSRQSVKVKELQERCIIKAFKLSYQEKYEHVGPDVTRSQEGKRSKDDDKRLGLIDDLKEAINHIHFKSKHEVYNHYINSQFGVAENPPLLSYLQSLQQLSSESLPSQFIEEIMEEKEMQILPTVQDLWVFLHQSFLLCWCDDEKLKKEFKNLKNVDYLCLGDLTTEEKQMLQDKDTDVKEGLKNQSDAADGLIESDADQIIEENQALMIPSVILEEEQDIRDPQILESLRILLKINWIMERVWYMLQWVNEVKESGLPFDIIIEGENNSKEYIEVKATWNANKAWFVITVKEWQFAVQQGESFTIARVLVSNGNFVRITNRNPVKLCKSQHLRLAILSSQ